MYDEIDYRFRKEAKELNNRLAFMSIAGIYIILFIVFLFVFDEHIFNPFYNYIILVVALGIVILLSVYLLIIVSIRKESSFSWKKICKFRTIINIYYDTVHENDIKLLIKLLKEFKIEYSGTGEVVLYMSPEPGYYVKKGGTIKLMLVNE